VTQDIVFASLFFAMKKHLLLLTLMLSFLRVFAQDEQLLQRILEAGNAIESVKSELHNHKEKDGAVTEKEGMFYYSNPDKFAALFDDDSYMVINGDIADMNIGIFHNRLRMRHGPVRSLSMVFLYAFQGRCADLAELNNFSLSTKDFMGFHVITMTSKKKFHLGFGLRQVIFKCGLNDLLVKEIILIDFKGTVNTFTLHRPQYNVSFDQSVFER